MGALVCKESHDAHAQRIRRNILRAPLPPSSEKMAAMSLQEWRDVDRTKVDGWRCSVTDSVNLVDESHKLMLTGSFSGTAVYVFRGPVVHLAVDAIVNAAKQSLLGGGGVDGAIHNAAGPLLLRECCHRFPEGCQPGCSKITKGYLLPAKFVIHTVAPCGEKRDVLAGCYTSSLEAARQLGLRSVAFCCVGTGIYGYPLVPAAEVAVTVLRSFLEKHGSSVFDAVVFACFRQEEAECYEKLLCT